MFFILVFKIFEILIKQYNLIYLKICENNTAKISNISKQVINVKLINKPNMLPML
jgi:hypothetical protein